MAKLAVAESDRENLTALVEWQSQAVKPPELHTPQSEGTGVSVPE